MAYTFIGVTNYTPGREFPIDHITLHHCAGVMDVNTIANVLQSRGVSAHYGVGNDGAIAQFVNEGNRAWSDGNWDSNQRTVSLEVSNSAAGGDWPVSDAAYSSAIALIADIAKRNALVPLVVGQNFFGHRDFYATSCPGDYLYSRMAEIADRVNAINGGSAPAPTPAPAPSNDLNAVADAVIRGEYGNDPDRSNRLRAEGYDPNAVQALVNAKLGYGGGSTTVLATDLDAVASAVIRGDYGNGEDRVKNLQAAGYDANAVQAIVNQKLGYGSSPAPTTPANRGEITVGSTVVPLSYVDYNGASLAKTRDFYYVSEIIGNRAVLNADGVNGPVYAAFNTNNLRRV